MSTMWKINLPGPLPEGFEKALRAGAARGLITVPDAWCYHIRRPAPPGGWTRSLRQDLRAGLLPEALETLWWDESVHPDGTWELWALRPSLLLPILPSLGEGRMFRGRICSLGHWEEGPDLSAFPNVAPLQCRPTRWPWRRIRRATTWILPPLMAAGALGWVWVHQERELARVNRQLQSSQQRVAQIQSGLAREKAILRALDPISHGGPTPFVADLDALTRLIPEDSRAVEIRWRPDRISLDLITPKSEVIRDALEASPEFRGVHFEGNLERRGERSRLTLSMLPEGVR